MKRQRRMLALLMAVLLVFGLTGCNKQGSVSDTSSESTQTPNRLISKSLDEIGISIADAFLVDSLKQFRIPQFNGIEQMDADMLPNGVDYGPKGMGNFTYVTTAITLRGQLDMLWASQVLMVLRAYPKDRMENAVVTLDYKEYTFDQLKPYILFETDDYIIYDLLFFESDETYEAFVTREYQPMFTSENNIPYNPDYLVYDYVKLQIDIREWLIEQIPPDFAGGEEVTHPRYIGSITPINIDASVEKYENQAKQRFEGLDFYGFTEREVCSDKEKYGTELGAIAWGDFVTVYGDVSGSDGAVLSYPLMELRAYKKDEIKDSMLYLDWEYYPYEELTPYLVGETGEYVIFDFLLFGEEVTLEEFYHAWYDKQIKYGEALSSAYLEADYIERQENIRNWLTEQIKTDFPRQ